MKKATIKDIARLSETSIATVSRVLNNSDYPVSNEAREKILKVADDLKYRPNMFSKILKGAVSKEIGVIIPNISNPYYAELVSAVERECMKRDFVPIILSSFNNVQLELRHMETLVQRQVPGVIMSSIGNPDKIISQMRKEKIDLVLFDQYYENLDADFITFDFYQSGYIAVDFLVKAGHKKIAFLTEPFDRASRVKIFEGFKDALKYNHLPFDSELVVISELPKEENVENEEFENGAHLVKLILERRVFPDAILAINDITAIGIMKELSKRKISVPGDVSVMGFDDISFSSMVTPGLTTIRQSASITGRRAARLLFDKFDNKSEQYQHIILSPELIIRKSVRGGKSDQKEF